MPLKEVIVTQWNAFLFGVRVPPTGTHKPD